jgi:hypothetical protein
MERILNPALKGHNKSAQGIALGIVDTMREIQIK